MEQGVQIYGTHPVCHISMQHRMHISEGMHRMYARKGGRRTPEEKENISNGMKKFWAYYKAFWAKQEVE